MKLNTARTLVITAALLAGTIPASAQDSELDKLKESVKSMEQTIEQMKQKIADLEKQKAQAPAATGTNVLEKSSASIQTLEKIAEGQPIGELSPVTYRHALNDQQDPASRPKDFTLDPMYRGFVPVPNTPILIQFNAKPRVDMTSDNRNAGNQNRFVPAAFPLQGASDYGGGEQFHMNANGSQLRIDVRAPELDGNPRFFYQNDFFGAGSDTGDMKYRVQHLYGQIYGFKAGFTYGVWEDPDIWPDTVDYEGPNSAIFSRRAVAQYTVAWNDNWNTTFGVEEPDIFVDVNSGPNPGTNTLTAMPDLGFNTRFEKEDFGHLQFSTMFRDIGAQDGLGVNHHVFGWGVNLSAALDLTKDDFVQLLGVYGEGVGGMGNDTSFLNSDGAFKSNGQLEALPYWSAMAGYTHHWSGQFRTTITYGYVNLDNADQGPTFYHTSQYASANLIWQIRKRLSVGLEGLFGIKTAQNGVDSGDHWRLQLGLVYSLFD
jgi:gas vesicle protein